MQTTNGGCSLPSTLFHPYIRTPNLRGDSSLAAVTEEKHPHLRGRRIVDRIVLGGSDGVMEEVAATAGLNGVGADFRTILFAGLAFAFAGAISIFFSSYLSQRSELDTLRIDMDRERMEIETEPEEERKELEELLKKEGYKQQEVDVIMARLVRNKEMWLRAQLTHELHLDVEELAAHPLARSASAGGAFLLFALVPLFPYLLSLGNLTTLLFSATLSILALFVLGATKLIGVSHLSWEEGLRSAGIGGLAAAVLYAVGRVLSSVY
jgi:vacuolar iron transporter family protein